MLPYSDKNPTARRPLVVYALIALNLAVFAYEAWLPPHALDRLVYRFGFVPYFFTQEPNLGSLSTPVTSMFLHGSGLHLGLNLLFLHVFGDNVEDVLGRARFVVFYIGAGLFAAFSQALVNPDSRVPMIGASGAIAGVLGAYFRLFPRARVKAWALLVVIELPAVLFIFIWFLLQLVSGIGSLGGAEPDHGGIAFFAHIGGFLAGLTLVPLLGGGRSPPASSSSQYGSGPP